MATALARVGWEPVARYGRGDTVEVAARDVDVLVVATPDGVIAPVARAIDRDGSTVVVHLAGSLGPDVLCPHEHRLALHPLVAFADPDAGADALTAGAWFGVGASTPRARAVAERIITDLGAHHFDVADADRATYHAAACVASNHLVALLGHLERIAATIDVPAEAYATLVTQTLANVTALGPHAALTGPVRRGDFVTVAAHLAALPDDERPAYLALAEQAARLTPTGHLPADLAEGVGRSDPDPDLAEETP